MMEILKQLPHLEPYGDPQYFVYIILAVLKGDFQFMKPWLV